MSVGQTSVALVSVGKKSRHHKIVQQCTKWPADTNTGCITNSTSRFKGAISLDRKKNETLLF
jgi:hypothetical protein